MTVAALPGQATLLSCWRALASTGFGPGRLVNTPHAVAAVFPEFAAFNNAILTTRSQDVSAAAVAVADLFATANVPRWALWVPSTSAEFSGPAERVDAVGSLVRDETTLVMTRTLTGDMRTDDRVRRISAVALERLVADEAVPAGELGEPARGTSVVGWALVHDGQAVTSVYTHTSGTDIGIYALGTLPSWRRRGFGRALLEHVLAEAHAAGVETTSLQSTPMGRRLYETLGYRARGRYEEWLHTSADTVAVK